MNKLRLFFLSRRSWTLPYLIFSIIFVIIPLVLIVIYAFTDDTGRITLDNFRKFLAHPEAVNTFVYSIGIALLTTIGCIVLGYPAAWILSRSRSSYSRTLIMLFILPMWINILIRTLATVALFDFASLPLGEGALIFGMIYNFIPFMIYPIYNTLQKMDPSYVEAAQDLGATAWQAFWRITVPLSKSGIVAGSMLVFIPCVGEYVIPELLGGPQTLMIGRVLWDEFFSNNDWPMAATVAVVMVMLVIVPLALFNKHQAENVKGAQA